MGLGMGFRVCWGYVFNVLIGKIRWLCYCYRGELFFIGFCGNYFFFIGIKLVGVCYYWLKFILFYGFGNG